MSTYDFILALKVTFRPATEDYLLGHTGHLALSVDVVSPAARTADQYCRRCVGLCVLRIWTTQRNLYHSAVGAATGCRIMHIRTSPRCDYLRAFTG